MKVLIVDDEPLELEILGKMIREISTNEVIKANNGLEAISYLSSQAIDLVFLDIQMPGMNGLEVLREIYLKWPSTIVSIISAFDDFQYAQEAIELGAVGYLLKPFTDEKFKALYFKMREAKEEESELHNFIIQSIVERSLFSENSLLRESEIESLGFVPEMIFIIKNENIDMPISINLKDEEVLMIPEPINGFTLILTTKKSESIVKQHLLTHNLTNPNAILYGIGESRSIKIAYAQALNDFQTRNNTVFMHFMNYVKTNYYKSLSLSDVAKEVHVSSSHLNRLLKKEYDKTFTEILMDFRINKSKELLLKNYSVEVVSDLVGFNSASYFAVCFKKFTGVSPSRYNVEGR